jgi:hypothetical protein
VKIGEYKVVDNYFPDWLVQQVRDYMCMMPVRWDNTSDYSIKKGKRFMGNMILIEDQWQLKDVSPHWFIFYLIDAIKHDICKELNITNTLRCLHNGQFPLESMNGKNHRDSDVNNEKQSYLSAIYMGYGNSGDCVIINKDNQEERISFKEGRLVLFNANTLHRGEAPIEGYRCSWGLVFPLFDPTGIKLNDGMLDPNAPKSRSWYEQDQPIN